MKELGMQYLLVTASGEGVEVFAGNGVNGKIDTNKILHREKSPFTFSGSMIKKFTFKFLYI